MEMGTPMGVIKFIAEWIAKNDFDSIHKVSSSYFLIYLLIGSINFLTFLALALFGKDLFFQNLTDANWQTFQKMLLIASAASFLSYFSSLFRQLLTGAENIAWLARIDLLKKGMELTLITFIFLFPGLVSLIYYYLILQIINYSTFPLLIMKWGKKTSIKNTLFSGWYGKYFIPVFKYGMGIFAIEIFRVSYLQLRPVILQMRSSVDNVAELVGNFGVLLTITSIMNIAAGSLMTVLVPAFARLLTGEKSIDLRNKRLISYTKKFTILFLLPVSILIVVSPNFMKVYLGEGHVFLAPFLRFWLFFSCFNLITTIYTAAIFAIGQIKHFFWFTLSNSIVSTYVIWLLAPEFGLWAAVIGTSSYFLLKFTFFFFYYAPNILKMRHNEFISSILPALITGSVTILVGLLLHEHITIFKNNYIIIILATCILSAIYFLFYFLFFIKQKKQFILSAKMKISNRFQ